MQQAGLAGEVVAPQRALERQGLPALRGEPRGQRGVEGTGRHRCNLPVRRVNHSRRAAVVRLRPLVARPDLSSSRSISSNATCWKSTGLVRCASKPASAVAARSSSPP